MTNSNKTSLPINVVNLETPSLSGSSMPLVRARMKQLAVVLMDVSPSMTGTNLVEANAALAALRATLAEPTNRDAFELAVVVYSDDAQVHLTQRRAREVKPEEITLATTGSGTNITDALTQALSVIDKAPRGEDWARPITVVMTDGKANRGGDPTTLATTLKAKADLIAVGFGADADMALLEKLANSPAHAVRCTDGGELRRFFVAVASSMSIATRTGQNAAALLGGNTVVRG